MILPHGGQLINRVASQAEKQEILKRAKDYKALVLNEEKITDVKNTALGVYSPLTGFLRRDDCRNVLTEMRLANGLVWPIPIVLDISKEDYQRLKNEKCLLLTNQDNQPIALLEEPEFYTYDKTLFAKNVFGTDDEKHPGVKNVYQMNECLAGGEIKLLDASKEVFPEINFTPEETRKIFQQRGWQTVVAFQTRNVPHRGHEFLQKYALQSTDGLFVQPVIGEKKVEDFKDEFILASYQLLMDKFYPRDKTFLGILTLKMRYAGPREAVFHALLRKNFGCSHFIVGRDHAGVGDYYGPFDAQKIFDRFKKEDIGIEILKYGNVVWCTACSEFVFEGACPHSSATQVSFSGSEIRERIQNKKYLPNFFMRPEIQGLLSFSLNPMVDASYNEKRRSGQGQKGFVLWFTGLPSSGKSTIANFVYETLKQKGRPVERLDGDIVRQSLTKDLGFSREDRDENIRRVGLVANALSKNGLGVLASFVSPYQKQRQGLREGIKNFIEVFCRCPAEVCEERDVKGLYARAKLGEIKNFTGVDDPYEEPVSPEIILQTDKETVEQCAKHVLGYLKEQGYFTS